MFTKPVEKFEKLDFCNLDRCNPVCFSYTSPVEQSNNRPSVNQEQTGLSHLSNE